MYESFGIIFILGHGVIAVLWQHIPLEDLNKYRSELELSIDRKIIYLFFEEKVSDKLLSV